MTTSDYLSIFGFLITLSITIYNTVRIKELEKFKITSSRSDQTLAILRDVIKQINEVEEQEEPKLTLDSVTMLNILDNLNTRARRITRITNTVLPYLCAKHQRLIQTIIVSYQIRAPQEQRLFFNAQSEDDLKNSIHKQAVILTALRKDMILIFQQEMQEILELQHQAI